MIKSMILHLKQQGQSETDPNLLIKEIGKQIQAQIYKRFQCNGCFTLYEYNNNMIQEEQSESYKFIKGEYATIKIKMEPQSLQFQVPLDWQINKIKCLFVKIMFKIEFDMFCFHHDGQQIPGDMLLRTVIELDTDEQCIKRDHYVLTFVKYQAKKHQFDQYYLSKMRPLVKSLDDTPFQPILHPSYYSLKYLNHINHIPIQGGRELIVNFNQLQQMQNVINEQRRQNPDDQNGGEGGVVGGGIMNNNNNGLWGGMIGGWLIRIIRYITIFTFSKFFVQNSNISVFLSVAFIIMIYFGIDYLKGHNKNHQNPKQEEQKVQIDANQQRHAEYSSGIQKKYYQLLIFVVETVFLVFQGIISFFLSLFPNWTVETHQQWFAGIHNSINSKLNQWKLKTSFEDGLVEHSENTNFNENREQGQANSLQQDNKDLLHQQ